MLKPAYHHSSPQYHDNGDAVSFVIITLGLNKLDTSVCQVSIDTRASALYQTPHLHIYPIFNFKYLKLISCRLNLAIHHAE